MMVGKSTALMSHERIVGAILLIRTQKVMLDATLAELYGVETRVLVQAVKRNRDRFPADFLFQLTESEFDDLKSQEVMSSAWGGRRARMPSPNRVSRCCRACSAVSAQSK